MQRDRVHAPEEYPFGRNVARNLSERLYGRVEVVPKALHSLFVIGGETSHVGVISRESLFGEFERSVASMGKIVRGYRTGVYSTDISIKAGMDLEMPGPGIFRGDQIRRQMGSGKLAEYDLDPCVKSVSTD